MPRTCRKSYEKKQEEICIFAAESPVKELEETARRIRRLVREKNLKYGEIAVITGNLEAYKSIASQPSLIREFWVITQVCQTMENSDHMDGKSW